MNGNGIWMEYNKIKLARWQSQYMSKGERPTLINFVLDPLPTCMMSVFPIPHRAINRLEKIRKKVFVQGNNEREL